MKKISLTLVVALCVVFLAGQTAADIQVEPMSYDYGDVEVDTSSTAIITITNVPGHVLDPLEIYGIYLESGSSPDFEITVNPGSVIIPVGESVDIEITFTPSAEGGVSATLVIASNDPIYFYFTVALSGTGVVPGPDIDVSPPSPYDFGNVVLGVSEAAIVTISNVGSADLTVTDIGLAAGSSSEFSIVSSSSLPAVIEAGGFVDVGLAFAPSALDYFEATLEIASDDADEPLVQVLLGGVGVASEEPPEGQIAAILSFFDASVGVGTLTGEGPGNSAERRLNALRNMLEAAGDLIEDDEIEMACGQLESALKKTDGLPRPPDFVTGPAAPVLKSMIEVLRTTLECE